MTRLYLILLFVFFCLKSIGRVDIKIGTEGHKMNSVIMLNVVCDCFGKDRVLNWLDSCSYSGVFICKIDSRGMIIDIPMFKSSKLSINNEDIDIIKKFIQSHKIKFSVIYENDLGENEKAFRKRIEKNLKRYFKHHKTMTITIGLPGYLSAPWDRYLNVSSSVGLKVSKKQYQQN